MDTEIPITAGPLPAWQAMVAAGELAPDSAQERAAQRLQALWMRLDGYDPSLASNGSLFSRLLRRKEEPPKGLYLVGAVGRGKSMLMDLFFETVDFPAKRRVHFNAFMVDVHERIHAERQKEGDDPIVPVARALAGQAQLLCFDEFQVLDVADAMILGRLFDQLFARGVVVVATSNVAPDDLYQGGLNRQLFLPFIELLKLRLDAFQLTGPIDYRLHRIGGMKVYLMPLSAETAAAMDAAWLRLTDERRPQPTVLTVLGRSLHVPRAAKGVARFSFGTFVCSRSPRPITLRLRRAFIR